MPITNQNKSNNTPIRQIDVGLIIYEDMLTQFIIEMSRDMDRYANRSAKNYIEEMVIFLKNDFINSKEKRRMMARTIGRSIKNQNTENNLEVERREAIKNAYESIKGIHV